MFSTARMSGAVAEPGRPSLFQLHSRGGATTFGHDIAGRIHHLYDRWLVTFGERSWLIEANSEN